MTRTRPVGVSIARAERLVRGRDAVIITRAPVVVRERADLRDDVTLDVRLERDGLDVTPAGFNPVTIVNPPRYIRVGNESILDPDAALREAVLDLVRGIP